MNFPKIHLFNLLALVIIIALAIKFNWFGMTEEFVDKLQKSGELLNQTVDEENQNQHQPLKQNNPKELLK